MNLSDKLYTQAKQVRVDCFFKGIDNAEKLINDKFEKIAVHLVCLDKKQQVVETGRVHRVESIGIISQMAVKKENQRNGVGQKILNELILKCNEIGVEKIELSTREDALGFYLKAGFKTIGSKYPSAKTGIIHQRMSMSIKFSSNYLQIVQKTKF